MASPAQLYASRREVDELRHALACEIAARQQALELLGSALVEQLEQLEDRIDNRIGNVHEKALRALTAEAAKGAPRMSTQDNPIGPERRLELATWFRERAAAYDGRADDYRKDGDDAMRDTFERTAQDYRDAADALEYGASV